MKQNYELGSIGSGRRPVQPFWHYYATCTVCSWIPLYDELSLMQHEDDHWQAHVTIEGCYTLPNRHPQFSCLTFHESDTSITGIPEWIECNIYRQNREMPVTENEFLIEIQNDKSIWGKDTPLNVTQLKNTIVQMLVID